MNKWKVMSHSQIGSSHLRSNKPNQDALKYVNGDLVIGAVSDGHGSETHKYSEIGAQLAVESAITVIKEVIHSKEVIEAEKNKALGSSILTPETAQTWLCAYFSNEIPDQIVTLWKSKVLAHFEAHVGFGDPEVEVCSVYKYYGCTLLAFFEYEKDLIFLQIGDGLIGIYEDTGRLIHPIIEDKRHINNQTTSLSDDYAAIEFKTAIHPKTDDIEFVAMTTDGIENAYPNHETDYIFFYHAIHGLILEDIDKIDCLLQRTSRYSGDDSTAIIFYKSASVSPAPEEELPVNTIVFKSVPEEYAPIDHYLCESTSSLFMGIAAELCYAFEQFERNDECVVVLALQDIWVNRIDKKLMFMDRVLKPMTPITRDQSRKLLAELLYQVFYKTRTNNYGIIMQERPKLVTFEKAWSESHEKPLSPKLWSKVVDEIRQMACFDYSSGEFVFDVDPDLSAVKLISQMGAYEIFYDTTLYLHQIMKSNKITNSKVGEIVTHPQNYKIWGMKNCSNHEWVQYMRGSDVPRYIPRGKVATIAEGSVIFMYGIPVTIKSRS